MIYLKSSRDRVNIRMDKIVINDIEIELIRKNIKNMRLSVHPPEGKVRLIVSNKLDEEVIRPFVVSKLSWIRKHQSKFQSPYRQSAIQFLSGESHYFMGSRYLLNVIESKEKQRVELRNDKYMDLYIRQGHTMDKCKKVVNEWYRKELKSLIPEYIDKWEGIMGVKVEDWGVKLMKTRWGTCNVIDKRTWINLELAKKNPRCLEYIIVHEMVHLLERNHNDKFKEYMDKLLPNWKSIKEELNG